MTDDQRLIIDVWSDYVCPFCYLEVPALDRLKQQLGHGVEVVWHAFELRPEPAPTLDPNGSYIRNAWTRSVYPMAAERGLPMQLPPVQPRSRMAFEAAFFARDAGRFEEMHVALFRAFFEHGRNIGEVDELLRIAETSGVDTSGLRTALDEGRYTAAVLEDQQQAHALGINAVPLMLLRLDGHPLQSAIPVQGAVPFDTLRAAVDRVTAQPA